MTEDPLTALLVDESEIARDELARVLTPYVKFTQSGEILLEDAFDELTTLERTSCVLLSAKALHLLGRRARSSIENHEITELTGMPPGTVGPKLNQLKKQKMAVKDDGAWEIPTFAVRRVISLIDKEKA